MSRPRPSPPNFSRGSVVFLMAVVCQRDPSSRKSSRDVGGREGEERWEDPDHPQGDLPQIWGETELNHSITDIVLKATANDSRHLALCHNEFRGPLPIRIYQVGSACRIMGRSSRRLICRERPEPGHRENDCQLVPTPPHSQIRMTYLTS
ncbi:uncharacterized protein TNCV_2403961 [Trichonephila clavipes]|nr:uncharacterized protein TNCV_2403961 [Trichonephila clavipes]